MLAIQALGGRVEYHKPSNFFQRNDWLRNQLGDETQLDVESVSQLRGDVTNAVLAHLKEMVQLRSLDLFGTQVTDAGLAQLTGLVKLEKPNLCGTYITDAGLVHLKGL